MRTRPYSYAQCTQCTRPCSVQTGRASHTGPRFVDFAVDHAKPLGFVVQACAKLAPSGIVHGFGHASFAEFGTRDIADHNHLCPVDNIRGGLVRPVFATVGDFGMDRLKELLGMVALLCFNVRADGVHRDMPCCTHVVRRSPQAIRAGAFTELGEHQPRLPS